MIKFCLFWAIPSIALSIGLGLISAMCMLMFVSPWFLLLTPLAVFGNFVLVAVTSKLIYLDYFDDVI